MKHELKNAFGKVFLTIHVDKENKWIHTTWEGYLSEATIREGSMAFTNALKEAGYTCVLNDMLLVVGPVRTSEWAVKEWSPIAADAGLKHIALVTAPNAIATDSVSEYHSRQTHFHTEVFNNIGEARDWIRQFCLQNA